MEEGKKYEVSFPNGDITTVELIKIDKGNIHLFKYIFKYLDYETRKPMTPSEPWYGNEYMENTFCLPGSVIDMLETKEL